MDSSATSQPPLTGYPAVPDLRKARSEAVSTAAQSWVGNAANAVGRVAYRQTAQPGFRVTAAGVLHPIAAHWAYKEIASAADSEARAQLIAARSDGMSWQQIGEALRAEDSKHRSAATWAFHEAAQDEDRVLWRCTGPGGCEAMVTDLGPVSAAPDVCESGHSELCSRHYRDVTAYRASIGFDDETGGDR